MVWTFDQRAGAHVYRLNGIQVPSVTELTDTEPVPYGPQAGERGRVIHRAALALDLDAYDPDDFQPYVEAFMASYRSFLETHRCRWRILEEPRVHPGGFGGTVDRIGLVDGLDTILDLKTGAKADWHRLQTCGYDMLQYRDLQPCIRRRYALYLSPTHYRFLSHTNPRDYAEFVQRARAQGVKL